MRRLDCTSLATTVASLASSLGISDTTARNRLLAARDLTDDDAFCEPDVVLREFLGAPTSTPPPSEVVWFHATRVLPSETFAQGLFPTHLAVSALVAMLETLSVGLPPRLMETRTTRSSIGCGWIRTRARVLTVAKLAAELRIGRTKAHEIARQIGFRIGAAVRVDEAAIERGGGATTRAWRPPRSPTPPVCKDGRHGDGSRPRRPLRAPRP